MSTCCGRPGAAGFALENFTVQRASRSFCLSLAGLAFHPSGTSPALIAAFSSPVFLCRGAGTIVDGTTEAMGVEVSSFYLADREELRLTLAATNGLDPESVGKARLLLGIGITGRVAKSGRPITSVDVHSDRRFHYIRGVDEPQYTSMCSVPLVWNEQAGVALNGIELFASPAVLEAALGSKLCDALEAERLRRRGPEYLPDPDDPFSQCPGIDQATVLVDSSNGRAFDRIGVYFGPYVAGPYAEGAFELEFPVDAKVLDAVKPEYRAAFTIRR